MKTMKYIFLLFLCINLNKSLYAADYPGSLDTCASQAILATQPLSGSNSINTPPGSPKKTRGIKRTADEADLTKETENQETENPEKRVKRETTPEDSGPPIIDEETPERIRAAGIAGSSWRYAQSLTYELSKAEEVASIIEKPSPRRRAFHATLPKPGTRVFRTLAPGEVVKQAAVAAGIGRRSVDDLSRAGIISSPIIDADYEEPYTQETEKEKAARRAAFHERFLNDESSRGISPEALRDTYDKEKRMWKKYFDWVEIMSEEIESEVSQRLERNDLIIAFEAYVQSHYQMIQHGEYKVFFTSNTLDLQRTDREGRTNLERLQNRLCPIGHDAEPMNFHHLTRHDVATYAHRHYGKSYLVLVSESLHREFSGPLHPPSSVYKHIPKTPVNRGAFDTVRQEVCHLLAEAAGQS